MAGAANQKLKLLYLMKIFLEKTDEENALTVKQLIETLSVYGISAERKSVYADIELLQIFGVDIEMKHEKSYSYYVASRDFELPELKLLIDAAQSSRFITQKKSRELIRKISTLTSSGQAKQLNRNVYINDRPKTINESIYYNVDSIHAAINDGKKIEFRYFDYNTDKQKVFRKSGAFYLQTPLTLCWNDDSYYLIAYSSNHDALVHYRVDRMSDVKESSDDADKIDEHRFDMAAHYKKVYGMYNGETVKATLRFDNSLVNLVIDRFGKDITIQKDGNKFNITADVSDSPVFLAWMFQFGSKAEIIAPQSLKESMIQLLRTNNEAYL